MKQRFVPKRAVPDLNSALGAVLDPGVDTLGTSERDISVSPELQEELTRALPVLQPEGFCQQGPCHRPGGMSYMPSGMLVEDEVVHVPISPVVRVDLLSPLAVAEPANSRLKQTEKEYGQKLAKSSQIIAELKTTVSSLAEENSRQQQRLQEVVQKFEDKKQQLITDNDRAIKDEVESYRHQVRAAERKLQRRELEAQEQKENGKVTALTYGQLLCLGQATCKHLHQVLAVANDASANQGTEIFKAVT
ncbi:hypothetical protein llap_8407 [Limosa lapponica baueri]|uniref:Uncharacterized protein n=1 Tax=Limosa lapponica baueri TaxID=1758121 RepID=A0A2I0U5F4_LIMLA|nr:hypothetical protein llap_8407 [Limosa lapponica baueri]